MTERQKAVAEERSLTLAESCRTHVGDARPQVSVCMAAYNGAQFILIQIRSILDQLEASDELIIVDDCSSDRTCELVESLGESRIHLIRHSRNLGVTQTFEDALRTASGSIIFLSDQDDIWLPDKVTTVLQAFSLNPDITLVISDAAMIDQDGVKRSESHYALRGRFKDGFLANVIQCKYLGCTMAFRAALLRNALPFPRSKTIFHDLWLGVANRLAGGKTHYLTDTLVSYRRHAGTLTGISRLSLRRQATIRLHLLWAAAGFWFGRRFGAHRRSD